MPDSHVRAARTSARRRCPVCCTDNAGNQEQRVPIRPEVRRDRPDDHSRRLGRRCQCQRLVQPPCRLHDPRHRRDIRLGRMPGNDIQRTGQRERFRHRRVQSTVQGIPPAAPSHSKYDATPPDVGDGQPARAADAAGWYNHAGRGRLQRHGLSCRASTPARPRLYRAGQRDGSGSRHLHRQGRQRWRDALPLAQVRRDRADRDRGAYRSPAGPRRLVHRSGAARRRGDRRHLRRRGMPDRHLRRAGLRVGLGDRHMSRRRRERGRPHVRH